MCRNPYPCDFDLGIIAAMAERFMRADGRLLQVVEDRSAPCRKKGAESCTYLVQW